AAFALSAVWLAGCPAPRGPGTASIAAQTLEVEHPGATLSGVAGNGATIFTAFTAPPTAVTMIEAISANRPGTAPAWHTELDGSGGPLVLAGHVVAAALGGTGRAAGIALRGEPGAVVAALDAATGKVAWKLAIDATEWAVVASLAATSDGVIAG